jgi:RNA recognition motif-containing protein
MSSQQTNKDQTTPDSFLPTSGSSGSDNKDPQTPPMAIVPGRKTVFIDNLPPGTKEADLRREIEPFGERLSSKFPKDQNGDVRCGVVKFKSPQQATNFISCFQNRSVKPGTPAIVVQYTHQEERETDPERERLFVTNLPKSVKASDLGEMFSAYGAVLEIDPFMARDGTSMGSATVRFATIEQATTALEAVHNKVLFPEDGRRIVVKYWEPHTDRQKHKREEQIRKEQGHAPAAPPVFAQPPALPSAPLQPFFPETQQLPRLPQLHSRCLPVTPQFTTPAPQQQFQSFASPDQPVRLVMCTDANGAPSVVHVDRLRPQSGDVAVYNAPISQASLVHILSSQYGPVMYCLPQPETGGFAVRMQNASNHQLMAYELNGALLSTGHTLRAGILTAD